ncbi:MAG: response regulator [Rhodospirillales bacterium]|nr:response regulator [Rhodospirillales bacterium]
MVEDRIPIVEDVPGNPATYGLAPWLLIIVDDDDSVHQATRFALEDFIFEGRQLEIISVYSAKEARAYMTREDGMAVVLLDVVMETETIGLELVKWIRSELENTRVRIVLRTGQPGYAPELQVVRDYDINDYKEKSQMTAGRLEATVYAALRSYRDIVHLEDQTKELSQALRSAEIADRAKTDFIKHMSHEFRTPLNGIIGLSEMIASEALGPIGNPKYKEYGWDIVTSGRHLQTMVERILEFSVSSDESPLTYETFDLNSLIATLLERNDGAKGKVSIRSSSETTTSARIESLLLSADLKATQTMLVNLISNAIKHNPPHCKVRVTARQLQDQGLRVSVIDNGVGIEPAILDRLGDYFNIVRDPYVSGEAGLGLGLVAVKTLIERHGGSIDVKSELGKGTTVNLTFPDGSIVIEPKRPGKHLN